MHQSGLAKHIQQSMATKLHLQQGRRYTHHRIKDGHCQTINDTMIRSGKRLSRRLGNKEDVAHLVALVTAAMLTWRCSSSNQTHINRSEQDRTHPSLSQTTDTMIVTAKEPPPLTHPRNSKAVVDSTKNQKYMNQCQK